MRIALVYPHFYPEEHWSTIAAQEKNLGVFPPLSLAYVASILEKSKHQVIITDVAAQNLSLSGVIKAIKKFDPHLMGFTITTSSFHQTLSWIKMLKEDVNVPVIVGGVHVGIYPAETMSHSQIDFALIGDVELSLPEFMASFAQKEGFEKVSGLCFRKGSEIVINERSPQAINLDEISFPARHLLPNNRYYSIVSLKRNFTAMITSRGCPFKCIFCDQGQRKPVLRSALNVVNEIEECYHKFNIREIDFFDPSFTVDKQRVIEMCRLMRSRNIDISWSFRTRADTVDEELLDEMSKAGCIRIMYGIESAVPAILKLLRKEVDIEQIKRIIALTNKKRIEAFGFFIIGSPGDTRQTVEETIRFARRSKLDHAQFTRMTVFPGTELYNRYLDKNHSDYWRKFVLDEKVKMVLPLIDTELSIDQANKLIRKAYLSFYLHPARIARNIFNMRSLSQLKKSIIALFDMLLSNHGEAA